MISFSCPPGYSGLYCEVQLASELTDSAGGLGVAAIIIVITLLVLLCVVAGCYVRRSGITP